MRRFMVAVALVVAVSVGGAVAATGTGPAASGWATPVKVAGGMFFWGMDLGVDAGGHVHLVAAGMRSGKTGVFYTTDRSGSWVTQRIVPWAAGATYIRPSVAVDGNGRLHIALDRVECVECSVSRTLGVFYLTDAGRARGTFGVPVRLTPRGTSQGSLRVAGGHVFLAFAGGWGDTLTKVRLLTNASGSWTTSVIATAGTHPFLRLSMDGKPRVVFEAATKLRYARAASVVGGWTNEPIPGTNADSDDPVLSIDEDGGTHAAWVDTSEALWTVRYAKRVAGAWQVSGTLGWAESVALSVDKPLEVWLLEGGASVQALDGNGSVFHAEPLGDGQAHFPAIKVLDSGSVIAAWVLGAPAGIWVARR